MQMEKKLNLEEIAGELVAKAPIKKEPEWQDDLRAPLKPNLEFGPQTVPLHPIKKEIDNSPVNVETFAVQEFALFPQTHAYLKTELTLDEEFLDATKDSIHASQASQQCLLDDRQAKFGLASKCSETFELSHNVFPQACRTYDRTYDCEVCSRTFNKNKYLKRHLITHSKDRKRAFTCHLCEKSFYSKHGLELHIKHHTGDTHNWELCGARFAQKNNLKRHTISCYTSEMPYKCKPCEKSFKTAFERDEHTCNPQRLRYKCKLCDKNYSNRKSLAVHSKEHTGLPWKCRVCEKKYANSARCRRHITEVHKITDKHEANERMEKIKRAEKM